MKKFMAYLLIASLVFSNMMNIIFATTKVSAATGPTDAPKEKVFKSTHKWGNVVHPGNGGDGKPNGKVLVFLDKLLKGEHETAMVTRIKMDENDKLAYCLNYDLPSPAENGNKYFKTDERLTDLEYSVLQYGHNGTKDTLAGTKLTSDQKYYVTQLALYIVTNDKGPKNSPSKVSEITAKDIGPYVAKGGIDYFQQGLVKGQEIEVHNHVATLVNKATRDTLKTPEIPTKYAVKIDGDKATKVVGEYTETGLLKVTSNHTGDNVKLSVADAKAILVDANGTELKPADIKKGTEFKIRYKNSDLKADTTIGLKVDGTTEYENVHKYEPYATEKAPTISQNGGEVQPQRMAWISDETEVATTTTNITFEKANPELKTTATYNDGSKASNPVSTVTIVDKVEYDNLEVGKEYTLKGKLMDKTSNSPLVVNGKEVTAEKTFKPTAPAGSENLEFTFNASALKGKEVVVFEDLYLGEVKVGTHSDINDEGQTVRVTEPKLKTTATYDDGSKENTPVSTVTVVDKVDYTDLIAGKEYTIKGKLMVKSTNKPLVENGKEITAEKTFTAEKTAGTVDLEFTFNASTLKGESVVVFEDLYEGNDLIGTHSDINDKGQTVEVTEPGVKTTATYTDGNKESNPITEVTIVDKVEYTSLKAGKEYTVKGKLMDKETNTPLIVNGAEVVAEKTFTAEASNGSVDLEFTFDASGLKGKEVVVFEDLYQGKDLIGSHADINDEGQTVKVTEPELKTTATFEDGTKEVNPVEEVTVVDVVEYKDLVVGKEYTVKGKLMDKSTNEPLLVDGNEVTAEKVFTAEEKDGTVELEFTFNVSSLQGKEIVVFEDLYEGEDLIGTHSDINDEGQTVRVTEPELKTTATYADGNKTSTANSEVTVVDVVEYTDLIAGKEYTVKGKLMDKSTNSPLIIDGEEVTAEKVFTAEETSGTVELEFTFNASTLKGKELVVFEDLYEEDFHIGTHSDINDEAQTVEVTEPTLKTTAKFDNGKKNSKAKSQVTIIDTVEYTGLVAGKEYTVKGKLMDKSTNSVLIVNGKPVTAEKTFVAKGANGSVDLAFTFNASGMDGKQVVVFEDLYHGEDLIGTHSDINDKGQTVVFDKPVTVVESNKHDDLPQMNTATTPFMLIVGLMLMVGSFGIYRFRKN